MSDPNSSARRLVSDLSGEVGLAEHLEAHVVQRHAGLLDVVDVHRHGRAAARMDEQGIGIMNVDLGLQKRHAQVGKRLRAGGQLDHQQLILGKRVLVQDQDLAALLGMAQESAARSSNRPSRRSSSLRS